MKKKFFIILILIVYFFNCKISNKNDILNDNENFIYLNPHKKNEKINLSISYKRLENIIGKNFIPITNIRSNFDIDSDEEYLICYSKEDSQNVFISIFDIGVNEILKKKYELETKIINNQNFSISYQNLFSDIDNCIILEGKSIDNLNYLYIISFIDDDFKKLAEFSSNYSILLNFKEIENDKGKYNIIKNIEIYNQIISNTNTNVKKQEIYYWNYDKKIFELKETKELYSTENLNIDPSILLSENKFLEMINGFWYPEIYKKIVEEKRNELQNYDEKNIKFIKFDSLKKEVTIKNIDYLDYYYIIKISKIWATKPGIRLTIKESFSPDEKYNKYIDIYLNDTKSLKVTGPDVFAQDNYVRLEKSFIDYVNEYKENIRKEKIEEYNKYLNGTFISNNYKFTFKDNILVIYKDNKEYVNNYKIFFHNNDLIISILTKENFLEYYNFIIKFNNNGFDLIPVIIEPNNILIKDLKAIYFKKI